MDEWVRNLIDKKFHLGGLVLSVLDLLLAVCITGTAVLLRISVMEYTPVTALKLTAMVLDFVMAILGAAFLWGRTGSRSRAMLTYALLVIWPVFAANSALWGKNGSFVGVLLILGLCLFDRGFRKLSLAAILAGAAVWLLGLQLPVSGDLLTLGWPNVYELICKFMFVELYDRVSLLFLLGLLLCMAYCMKKKQVHMTGELLVPFLLFLFILVPFFAPYMPAWAGYGADVLAVLWALLEPKKCCVAFLHVIVSYSAYACVLNGESKLPMAVYSAILFALLLAVGIEAGRIMDRGAGRAGE